MPERPSPPLSDGDYHVMEAAMSETGRGRAFLAEHARRARAADTRLLLSALERIEGGGIQSHMLTNQGTDATPVEPEVAHDPWAAMRSMSEEEKIVMFS